MNFDRLKQAVIQMQDDLVTRIIRQTLKDGAPPQEILEQGLIAGMKEVGELFKRKEYFVPEVLLASEAFYAGFDIVRPLIRSTTAVERGKVIIGVVKGDIHDIGKNIVKVLVEASGYQVIDLGKDVPTEKFINAVARDKPDVLALSSLMTTTMTAMGDIIKVLEERGLRERVKVIVGGAPVNEEFARRIHADGFGRDAADAVSVIEELLHG